MQKNVAGQKWRVFAFNRTTNQPVTGDAANITAKLSIDHGSRTALTDTNPTEAEDGFYLFDLAQAETNGHDLAIYPESTTANVVVVGVPGNHVTQIAQLTAAGTPTTLTSVAEAGTALTLVRGETWTVDFQDLDALTDATKVYVTIRADNATDADSASTLQASSTAGLVRLNGAAAVTPTDATVTITQAASPAVVRLVVKPAATATIEAYQSYSVDVKAIYSTGVVRVLYRAAVRIVRDVTRATT